MKIVYGLLFAEGPTMPYTALCTAIKFNAVFASDLSLLGNFKVIDALPRNIFIHNAYMTIKTA